LNETVLVIHLKFNTVPQENELTSGKGKKEKMQPIMWRGIETGKTTGISKLIFLTKA